MPLPRSYEKQDVCPDCRFVFTYEEYDEDPQYYCTRTTLERPLCGSNKLHEEFYYLKGGMKSLTAWRAWAKKQAVDLGGWCKHFKQKKE